MLALLAGVKSETAFRTLANRLSQILQERSTLGAARYGASPGHVEGPGAEGIFSFGSSRSFAVPLLSVTGAVTRVFITALAVFWIGQRTSAKLPHSAPLPQLAQVRD